MRIALIHALRHSPPPIEAAFARLWPEARLMNLLDDSLSADLARHGRGLDATMHERFARLAQYAVDTGAVGILFTCSAFGPCIEAVARAHAPMPVLKPNEAMIERASAQARRVGLLSTFAPTLASMPAEFPSSVELVPRLAEGALAALDRGDRALHDRLVAQAAAWGRLPAPSGPQPFHTDAAGAGTDVPECLSPSRFQSTDGEGAVGGLGDLTVVQVVGVGAAGSPGAIRPDAIDGDDVQSVTGGM